MRSLPNAESVIIEESKISGYLLSMDHPYGRHKAEFFQRFGFYANDWRVLVTALRNHAMNQKVTEVDDTPFGSKYIIDGPLETPDARNPSIRSVWFLETNEEMPRFVTAYPL